MASGKIDLSVCCLCGEGIDADAQLLEDALSMDHVPPKQFYPKETRGKKNLNLWVVPTHRRCNEDYREDEEYFCHATSVFVRQNHPKMGVTIFRDLARRTHKPQTPAMIRRLLKDFRRVSEGGIQLPPGIVEFGADKHRTQRVVIRIAQGLFFLDHGRHMPREDCRGTRLCLDEADVPELYTLSWQAAEAKGVYPQVFSYRHFDFEGLHLWSMFFWEAFTFCTAFEDPLDGRMEEGI